MEIKTWSKSLIFSIMSVAFVLAVLCCGFLISTKTESSVFAQTQNQLTTKQNSFDAYDDCCLNCFHEHDDCECEECCGHNHEHCDACEHQECFECEECHNQEVNLLTLTSNIYINAVLSLSPSKTYCSDGKNFYSFEGYTQHYKCTNPEHSGNNDYTTSSVGGTCYQTENYHWKCTVCGKETTGSCYHGDTCSRCYGSGYVSSSYRYDCESCNGNGTVTTTTTTDCSRCSGSGQITTQTTTQCSKCKGAGTITCTTCGGSGAITTKTGQGVLGEGWTEVGCPSCGGWGEAYHAYFNSYDNLHYGSGSVECPTCDGFGDVTSTTTSSCPACNGTGSISTTTTTDCSSCNGRGYKIGYTNVRCSMCLGEGIVNYSDRATQKIHDSYTSHKHNILPSYESFVYKNIDTGQTIEQKTALSTATGFTIKYNLNQYSAVGGGNISGSMMDQYFLHNHTQNLQTNQFVFENHRFLGWSTNSEATVAEFKDGQAIKFEVGSVPPNSTLNLYAIWVYQLEKPTPTSPTSFNYDGGQKVLEVKNFSSAWISQSGITKSKNVGNYSVVYSLLDKSKIEWTDKTTSNVVINWSILLSDYIVIPSQNSNLVYNGSQQNVVWKDYDGAKMTVGGTVKATNAGTYNAVFGLKDPSNTCWSDGTTTPKTITWKIAKRNLSLPQLLQTSYAFHGEPVSPIIDYDEEKIILEGTLSASAVGTYSTICNVKDTNNNQFVLPQTGYITNSFILTWNVVNVSKLAVPSQKGQLIYNGLAQMPSWNDFSTDLILVSGETNGRTAGEYFVVFSLKDPDKNTWIDGSVTNKVVSWTILKQSVTKPSFVVSSFEYTGNLIYVTTQNYDSSLMFQNGTTFASQIGGYAVTYTLKDSQNYVWQDGTTNPVILTWNITKTSSGTVDWDLFPSASIKSVQWQSITIYILQGKGH